MSDCDADEKYGAGLDYAMAGGCGDDYGTYGAYGGDGDDGFDMKIGGYDSGSYLAIALLIVTALILVYYAWYYERRRRAKDALHKITPAKPYHPQMHKLGPTSPHAPPHPSSGFQSNYGNRFVGGSGVSGRGLGAGQVGAGLIGVGMSSAGMSSGMDGGCSSWDTSATSEASAIATINGGDMYASF